MATGQEQFNRQFNDSIKLLCDLTSRMEERIKNNNDQLNDIKEALSDIKQSVNDFNSRIMLIEAEKVSELKKQFTESEKTTIVLKNDCEYIKKAIIELEQIVQEHTLEMEAVIKKSSDTESKLGKIIDYVWKLGFLLLSGYIYYKFGWNVSSP
jgi:chromosome segregation ATPase